MSGDVVFSLRDAGVAFDGGHALRGIDLDVRQGERIAVIGPSGAGKSTLIGLLNGTVIATTGSVLALGRDYTCASTREIRRVQRRIGTIYQQFDLVGQLRAVHNVNAGRLGCWPFWRAALSLAFPRDTHQVREALARVGIADKFDTRTADLSGGEQQRVAIARVLVQRPAAILADEPVASLDPARGREIIELLHDVSVEAGTTLLASLHDVGMAVDRFERVVGLRAGRIVFDEPPGNLARHTIDALYELENRCGSGP
ncbi:phosphonate ABC transporter ATP-binding protein [Actinokineospora sp.]|uniref:phosphonate ABC transporter ATP-binding protein n=1 Tax=Actinokineospora sp. TaxID=1872133 RepID=UPI00403824CE